jgi:hypothetical protein
MLSDSAEQTAGVDIAPLQLPQAVTAVATAATDFGSMYEGIAVDATMAIAEAVPVPEEDGTSPAEVQMAEGLSFSKKAEVQ